MRIPSGDPSVLRRLNSVAVLRALYQSGHPTTLTGLCSVTGLSRPTCEEAAAELISQGRVAEVAPSQDEARRPGRPARRLVFNASAGVLVGIDIGAHKVLTIVTDLRGDVLASRRISVAPDQGAADRLQTTQAAVRACLSMLEEPAPVSAVVVAAPGVIAADGTVSVTKVLPGWTGLDLTALIADVVQAAGAALAGPVSAGNDVNLAALAEHWRGVAQQHQDLIYIHAGHRLGAGILINEEPHGGAHGAAGEIGHLDLLGWAESYRRLLAYQPDRPVGAAIEAVFTATVNGDRRAAELVDGFAHSLALGVAAMALTIDPELVVIGGGVSQAGSTLIEPVRHHLKELCLFPPEIQLSSLGDEAVALGAVRAAQRIVEQRLFSPPGNVDEHSPRRR